jgi:arsenate reductase-like glutaredoxin family protein
MLGLSDPVVGDERILAAMRAHPVLMQRPIFVYRGRAVIGRPPERVLELLWRGTGIPAEIREKIAAYAAPTLR